MLKYIQVIVEAHDTIGSLARSLERVRVLGASWNGHQFVAISRARRRDKERRQVSEKLEDRPHLCTCQYLLWISSQGT